ncbi:MAG: tRNA uridine-5-carboxymethylaminomethyl(34) synthesis GTPase MnmE, partial [Deltaproteobacteria bacterium]|nr:tRNA uridine-5-carboxymethylaminomethyl(34) synthesis GTPase MnmE [Deltaproteobacteria bacterium]
MVNLEETIAAVATPPGQGGIGIVRLSGPRAGQIGRTVFKPARPELFQERRLTYGWAVSLEAGQIVDEVLAVFMKGPRTYTGQDVFEIQAHGGPLVLSQVLRSCLEAGARPAGPG